MAETRWPRGGFLLEFGDPDELRRAVRSLRTSGYAMLEFYAPYPLEDLTEQLGYPRSRLPLAALVGGVLGGAMSYAIQYYTSVHAYPLNIGARPVHAVPAFLVATFEGTILFAALGAFFGLLWALRLPELWHPVFEVDGFERASVDRFWLALDGRDPRVDDRTGLVLERLGALRVVRMGGAA